MGHSRRRHGRPPAQPLRMGCHNVRGLSGGQPTAKLAALVRQWVDQRLDIVCLQETHLHETEEARAEHSINELCTALFHNGYNVWWSSRGAGGSAGVAILVSRALLAAGAVTGAHAALGPAGEGRLQQLGLNWGGHHLQLVNAYLPSGNHGGQMVFIQQHLLPLLEAGGRQQQLWAGDWNFVLQPIDRSSRGGQRRPGGEEQVAAFWEANCAPLLHDAFRLLHPHRRSYTYLHRQGASRLDRVHVSERLRRFVRRCDALSSPSDHRLLVTHLLPARAPSVGRGWRRVRLQFFRMPHLAAAFEQHAAAVVAEWMATWDAHVAAAPPPPPDSQVNNAGIAAPVAEEAPAQWAPLPEAVEQERMANELWAAARQLLISWPAVKHSLAQRCWELEREARAAARAATAATTAAAHAARVATTVLQQAAAAQPPDAEAVAVALAAAVQADQEHAAVLREDPRAQEQAAAVRAAGLLTGERPCPWFTHMLKPPASASVVPALRNARGQLVHASHPLPAIMASHFAAISTAPPADPAAQQLVLAALQRRCTPIPGHLAAAMEGLTIGEEEIRLAWRRAASGTAPGLDGLPLSLYRRLPHIFLPALALLFSCIGSTGTLPPRFLDGVIRPIPKDGDASNPSNYRPIALLNTDYRLLAPVLTARLLPALSHSIDREQTAFLPGRRIGENALLLQALPQLLRGRPAPAAVAFLDFRKAFDTVDRSFLLRALEVVGVGPGFRAWVRLLLSDTRCSAVVNGHLCPPVPFTAGVRQGCPLSPLLYLVVAQALLSWLKERGHGVQLQDGSRLTASQFADDLAAFLESLQPAHVDPFVADMVIFGNASGQRTNVDKSELMPLGGPVRLAVLPAQVAGMRVVTRHTTLGITFTTGRPTADWAHRLAAVRSPYARLPRLRLSTFGRAFGVSTYGVSRLLYHVELAGLLSGADAAQLHQWTAAVVDRSEQPRDLGAGGPRRMTGVPTDLLAGSPGQGGFGCLGWAQHCVSRHASWVAGFLRGCLHEPQHRAPWTRVMRSLLSAAGGLVHHPLQLLAMYGAGIPAAYQGPWRLVCDAGGHVWTRFLVAIAQLPAPTLPTPAQLPAPGPWCAALPLWCNPLLTHGGQQLQDAAGHDDVLPLALQLGFRTVGDVVSVRQRLRRRLPDMRHDMRGFMLAYLDLFDSMRVAGHLRPLLPAPWVAAAEQHEAAVAAGRAQPVSEAALLQLLLPLVSWPGPRLARDPPHPHTLTVKQGTHMLLQPVRERRAAKHAQFVRSAFDQPLAAAAALEELHRLQSLFPRAWRQLPVANRHKDLWWRMAVDGVVGAHADLQGWMVGLCACAAAPQPDLRLHHLWACPLAVAMVAELSRVVAAPVQRHHLWLLQPASPACTWHVWALACWAALHAMDRGRASLTRQRLAQQGPHVAQPAWLQQEEPVVLRRFWQCLSSMVADLNCTLQAEAECGRVGPAHRMADALLPGQPQPFLAFDGVRFSLSGHPVLPWDVPDDV